MSVFIGPKHDSNGKLSLYVMVEKPFVKPEPCPPPPLMDRYSMLPSLCEAVKETVYEQTEIQNFPARLGQPSLPLWVEGTGVKIQQYVVDKEERYLVFFRIRNSRNSIP
jgi:hypothetical protein